ncbi:MAG: tetratricopeptide repeat protein [Planctomycetes bacterium]|nr:tetratricopeptide repeat protein [Planctomycetota bacterium]
MLHRAILLACVLAPFAAAAYVDEADDQAAFVEGLAERGLHDMTASEAQKFLAAHPQHAQAPLVRYRLAVALQELQRPDEARPHLRALAALDGFRYRGEAALRLAQCALAADALDEAATALDTALRDGEAYLRVPATFLRAEVDFRRDAVEAAAKGYAAVLEADAQGPYARDAAAGLAWCASKSGDSRSVLAHARRALEGGDDDALAAEMHFLQGEAQRDLGRPAEALAAYARVTDGPFADAALRGAAFARTTQGDGRAAADAWTTLLARFPQSRFVPEATLQLGIRQVLLGDFADGERTLAAPAVAASAEARVWRARALVGLERPEDALAMLDRADAARPDDELAKQIASTRGDVLTSLGRSKDAAAAYARAGSDDARHAAAVSSLNAGDASAALELVTPLLASRPDDPALALTAGEALFALERYAEAAPRFAVAAHTDDVAVRARCASRAAWCRYLGGDAAGAVPLFGAVVTTFAGTPESAEALFMQGRAADESGDASTARKAWQRYVDEVPDGASADEALAGLARLLPGADGLAALDRLLAEHPQSAFAPSALYDRAERLSAAGRYADAERDDAALLAQHPEHPLADAARYALAWAQVEQAHFDAAETTLQPLVAAPARKARRNDPPPHEVDPALRASALELLLWCAHERGDADAAESSWRALAALTVEPARKLDAARSASETLVAAGRPAQARALFAQLADTPVGVDALIESTWIALDADDVDGAEASVRDALRRVPSGDAPAGATSDVDASLAALGEAAFFVAEARFAAGDDARAVPLYESACAIPGEHRDDALYKRGFCALRAGDDETAAASFATLVAEHPKSPLLGESLFLLGEARVRQERWTDAVPPLRRVLDELPRHAVVPKARFRLGQALCALGQYEAAEPVLADLARSTPDFPNLLEAELLRGEALAALGRGRTARSTWQRVIDQDDGVLSARARLATGRLDLAAGATEQALSEFLKVAVLYTHDDEVSTALLLAGDCLLALGDRERAADRWREILEKHPDAPCVDDARRRLSTL